jgi:hypothetical protein
MVDQKFCRIDAQIARSKVPYALQLREQNQISKMFCQGLAQVSLDFTCLNAELCWIEISCTSSGRLPLAAFAVGHGNTNKSTARTIH